MPQTASRPLVTSTKQSKLKETYVYFSFPEPVTIDELWIKNGFWKITSGKDQYTRNSRIKELGIAFLYADSADYADRQTIKLKDDKKRNDWQKVYFGELCCSQECFFLFPKSYKLFYIMKHEHERYTSS